MQTTVLFFSPSVTSRYSQSVQLNCMSRTYFGKNIAISRIAKLEGDMATCEVGSHLVNDPFEAPTRIACRHAVAHLIRGSDKTVRWQSLRQAWGFS